MGGIDIMRRDKAWSFRFLAVFLAVMAAGTVISRTADSLLVAKVRVQKPGRGRLTYSCEGEGRAVPAKEDQIFLWPEQQVEWTAKQGSTVKAGECLVQFRKEYLDKAIADKQVELERLELQERQQLVSARIPASVPAAEGASQSLAEAEQRLAAARQKETEAQRAYDAFLENEDSGGGLPEETGETGESEGAGGEETDGIVEGKGAEGLEGVRESGIQEYGKQEREFGTSESGRREQEFGIQENGKKEQELESALREAEAETEAASQAVAQAQNAKSLADREDAASQVNAANAAEAAMLGADATGVQIETVRTELERLRAYQEADGKILAEEDCIVLQTGAQPGIVTTGSEVFVTGSGGFWLKGEVKEADKEKVKAGSSVKVRLGAGKEKTVQIDRLELEAEEGGAAEKEISYGESGSSSGRTVWYAHLPEHTEVQNAEKFGWTMEIVSAKEYEQTIPLTALRENVTEAYCLVLSEEEQMLGTVQIAKRVPVTVLEKDGENAAVTSGLRETDKVIVYSEKYVEEGDRVRIQNEE